MFVFAQRPQQRRRCRRFRRHGWQRGRRRRAGECVKVRGIDHTLPPACHLGVRRDHASGMADLHPPAADNYLNPGADQAPWHAVAVGIELDGALRRHLAHQLAALG